MIVIDPGIHKYIEGIRNTIDGNAELS